MILNLKQKCRFYSKISLPDSNGCLLWTGAKSGGGYGQIRVDGVLLYAHRVSYELHTGSIGIGLTIDHLCRVRSCVNPDHLEAVTNAENVRRGEAGKVVSEMHRNKTHCPAGHHYDEVNTYINPKGERRCRKCHNKQQRGRRIRIAGV